MVRANENIGVIMSMSPYYCYMYMEGGKEWDVRKTAPKTFPKKVLFYVTQDEKSLNRIPESRRAFYRALMGFVAFECPFNGYERIQVGQSTPQVVFDKTKLSLSEIARYEKGAKYVCLWRLGNVQEMSPKVITSFKRVCIDPRFRSCINCNKARKQYTVHHINSTAGAGTWVCINYMSRAPQAWEYFEF